MENVDDAAEQRRNRASRIAEDRTMPVTTTSTAQRDQSATDVRGRRRVVIERIAPAVDAGRFPAKRSLGEDVEVTADIFCDGHDRIAAELSYRHSDSSAWRTTDMKPLVNDRWTGTFSVDTLGQYEFTIRAWVDHFGTWQRDLERKYDADQDITVDLKAGADLIEAAADNCAGPLARELKSRARELTDTSQPVDDRVLLALDEHLARLVRTHAPTLEPAESGDPLRIHVDRERARFSSWYELFPRSTAPDPGRHGTFADVEARLPYVAQMGFDVLYMPPIHPIGRAFRKGPNNTLTPRKSDPGSPWAIGAEEGGHKSIHPQLGTLDDFRRLVAAARDHDIEIALDIALQCAPDHPYVKEHPEWFRKRPDGSIQYAENPPKKYQDIYPFDFETEAWESMWRELKSIFDFWIEQGVTIFRVDNPHTKAFSFWQWCIGEITRDRPDIIFLSEAFTRPKVMYRLAKLGFTQSYTYFAWRNQPWEIEQYFTELTQTDVVDFFRPNAWPNTPDILTEYLQQGGRPASMIRLILAATLCANYGIYGPVFELCEVEPRQPGSEEYLDSEKYQQRTWNLDDPRSLRHLIGRVNRIRRQNSALQHDRSLRFHHVDNPSMVCYSKQSPDGRNTIVTVVNTNPYQLEAGTVSLDLSALGLETDRRYQVHDLLTDARYIWHGPHNYVELDPGVLPAHVFAVRQHHRTEQNFEYFL